MPVHEQVHVEPTAPIERVEGPGHQGQLVGIQGGQEGLGRFGGGGGGHLRGSQREQPLAHHTLVDDAAARLLKLAAMMLAQAGEELRQLEPTSPAGPAGPVVGNRSCCLHNLGPHRGLCSSQGLALAGRRPTIAPACPPLARGRGVARGSLLVRQGPRSDRSGPGVRRFEPLGRLPWTERCGIRLTAVVCECAVCARFPLRSAGSRLCRRRPPE